MSSGSERAPSVCADVDRRVAERHFACFPAHVETLEGPRRTAVIRDLSVTGTLLLTRAELMVGETVQLSLHLRPLPAEPLVVGGTVVRFEAGGRDVASVWPHLAAVQFVEPLVAHEAAIRETAQEQLRLGVRPLEGVSGAPRTGGSPPDEGSS